MQSAIFAGSFDPWTYGHSSLLVRAAQLFSRVVVGVCVQPIHKNTLLASAVRVELVQRACSAIEGVEVKPFNGLITEFCNAQGIYPVIRGVRNAHDFQYEWEMYQHNKVLEQKIEWLLLPCDRAYTGISASLVKEIHALGGDVSHWVNEQTIMYMDRERGRNGVKNH